MAESLTETLQESRMATTLCVYTKYRPVHLCKRGNQ